MRKLFDNLGLVESAAIGDPVRILGVANQDEFGPRLSTSRLVAAR